jgi:hypothetical protein
VLHAHFDNSLQFKYTRTEDWERYRSKLIAVGVLLVAPLCLAAEQDTFVRTNPQECGAEKVSYLDYASTLGAGVMCQPEECDYKVRHVCSVLRHCAETARVAVLT